MRYALISDIHANRPALEATLAAIYSRDDIDAVYHLGDLVGYAPWPDDVVEILQNANITGVAGNYDSTVATDYRNCGCRYEDPHQSALAHESYAWTRAHVTPVTKAQLGTLPFRIDLRPLGGHAGGPRLVLVHAHTSSNLIDVEEARPDRFLQKMAESAGLTAGDVIAFGHTHKPWHRVLNGIHFVNAGSVGRPKDGDPRTCYVVATIGESDAASIEFVRTPYDVDAAARGILESDLPNDFAQYLRTGGKFAVETEAR